MNSKIRNLQQLIDAYIDDVKEGKSCMGHRKLGNLEFRGGVLYSYGWYPIAKYIGGARYMVTGDKYSKTTARHIRALLRTIPYTCGITTVPSLKNHLEGHRDINYSEYEKLIATAYNKVVRARLPHSKIRWGEQFNYWLNNQRSYRAICAESDNFYPAIQQTSG